MSAKKQRRREQGRQPKQTPCPAAGTVLSMKQRMLTHMDCPAPGCQWSFVVLGPVVQPHSFRPYNQPATPHTHAK